MTDRQLHILTVSLVLSGPVITSISGLADGFYLTFYLFPVTINSLVFSVEPQDLKEVSIVGLIVSLFFIKVLVIGIISLFRLYRRRIDRKLLYRFYILVFIICLFKLIGFFVSISESIRPNEVIGLIAMLSWAIVLGVIIKRQRTTNAISHAGTVSD